MTEHKIGTREDWLAARLELLKAEKELTRRSDERYGNETGAPLEYAKSGIRINAIAPGLVETEMLEEVAEDNKQLIESLKSKTPIGRIGDPQEIANAVVWLLSDKASFVLGHTLLVDGGIVSR